jgi:hypothetical protein
MRQSSFAWSRAYALQAQADLDAREALLGAMVPACQHLHFLQMAHRCLGGADPESLKHSHGFAEKVLPQIARELMRRSTLAANLDVSHKSVKPIVQKFSREVDLLAPSVDDNGRRPDNCEYPWEDAGGALNVPAEYAFATLGTMHCHRAGATFLKIVTAAAAELRGGYYASA